MTVMHGVIEAHGALCRTLGLRAVAPRWLPDWVPGFCHILDLYKEFPDTATAIGDRAALLAVIRERGIGKHVTVNIHVEPPDGCDS